jgi:hypothetical protein
MVRGSEHLNMESNKGVEPDIVTEVLNPWRQVENKWTRATASKSEGKKRKWNYNKLNFGGFPSDRRNRCEIKVRRNGCKITHFSDDKKVKFRAVLWTQKRNTKDESKQWVNWERHRWRKRQDMKWTLVQDGFVRISPDLTKFIQSIFMDQYYMATRQLIKFINLGRNYFWIIINCDSYMKLNLL